MGRSLLKKVSLSAFLSAPDGAYTFTNHTSRMSTAVPLPEGVRNVIDPQSVFCQDSSASSFSVQVCVGRLPLYDSDFWARHFLKEDNVVVLFVYKAREHRMTRDVIPFILAVAIIYIYIYI
jgi:hypothetical protein